MIRRLGTAIVKGNLIRIMASNFGSKKGKEQEEKVKSKVPDKGKEGKQIRQGDAFQPEAKTKFEDKGEDIDYEELEKRLREKKEKRIITKAEDTKKQTRLLAPPVTKNPKLLKDFLKHSIKEQELFKEDFEYGFPDYPGTSITQYLYNRDKKTYFFTSPIKHSHIFETLGLRVRTGEAKLRYEFPTVYPKKRFPAPDQFKYEIPPECLKEYIRKDSYFEDFVPPYELENEEFKKCIEQLKEGKNQTNEMISLLPQLSLKDLSTLALKLSIEVPLKDKEFWEQYGKITLEKYYLFPRELLWRMRYGFRKLTTDLLPSSLKHKIYLRAVECVKITTSIKEILSILKAFQGTIRPNLYFSALSTLITRRDELMSLCPEAERAELIVNLVYVLGICRPRHWGSMLETAQQNTKEFLAHYEDIILDHISKASPADSVKLLQGMSGLRTHDYQNILHRIEKQIVLLKDKLIHDELAEAIWGFAHANDGGLWGTDKTFGLLEPLFMEKAKLMNHWQVSRCAYTFAARKHNSEELFKYLDKRLQEEIPNMKYASLHNVAYYLLMREIKDERFWKDLVNATLAIPDVLPLVYYYPFKLCWQYLEGAKPEWDVSVLGEKLWWAERLKIAVILEEEFLKNEEYADFLKVFSVLKLEPAIFYTYENTYQVHFAFPEMKVGIMIYLNKDMVPETMRVNESKLIPSKILRARGWEILDLSFKEFVEMGKKHALKYLKEWLELSSDIQAEAGVAPKIPAGGYV